MPERYYAEEDLTPYDPKKPDEVLTGQQLQDAISDYVLKHYPTPAGAAVLSIRMEYNGLQVAGSVLKNGQFACSVWYRFPLQEEG